MMPRQSKCAGWIGWGALAGVLLMASPGRVVGQEPDEAPEAGPVWTTQQLIRMSCAELNQLYMASPAAPMPQGKVRGRAIISPGSKFAPILSAGARAMWQGKVFCPEECIAVNRFFGVRAVKGRLYYAPSWMDGGCSLILDYEDTSLVYRQYRDEIRQIAPGLLLGVMYARTTPEPKFKMYFILETCP
jgi:hypothetical protein